MGLVFLGHALAYALSSPFLGLLSDKIPVSIGFGLFHYKDLNSQIQIFLPVVINFPFFIQLIFVGVQENLIILV